MTKQEKMSAAMKIVYPTQILFMLGGQAEEVQFWAGQPESVIKDQLSRTVVEG